MEERGFFCLPPHGKRGLLTQCVYEINDGMFLTGKRLFSLVVLASVVLAPAARADRSIEEKIDAAVAGAVSRREIPSAVVYIGRFDQTLYEKSFGGVAVDARYDLASLTKPYATALSVHRLIEQGRLTLETRVKEVFPEFTGGNRELVTIGHLLAHESGLPAGVSSVRVSENPARFPAIVLSTALSQKPGVKFVYSDAGYQLLGLIVEKVSGKKLGDFASDEIYRPLGLSNTGYGATSASVPSVNCGACARKPHDPVARAVYPNTVGHAGLYSTARELAQIQQIILRDGRTEEGAVFFLKETISRLMKPFGLTIRSLGFDLTSPYANAPRGLLFPEGVSFGHTGYTGTSTWTDPTTGKFVILLTNRTFVSDTAESRSAMAALRREIATLAAQL